METVNPLVFNCNNLVYRRVENLHITDANWKKYSPALTSAREYSNFNQLPTGVKTREFGVIQTHS